MAKWLFAVVLMVHGLLHLLGFAESFSLSNGRQIRSPVPAVAGLLWAVTTLLFVVTAVLVVSGTRSWLIIGAAAVLVSQGVILTAWSDAKFGTMINLIIAIPLVIGIAGQIGLGYQAQFEGLVETGRTDIVPTVVTEADVSPLPLSVQRYLTYSGVIGKHQIRNFRLTFRGSFRNGARSPWMTFTAEQFTRVDVPMRAFHIRSSMFGIPFEGLHLYTTDTATMQVKLASIIPVVDGAGPEMRQSETVTMFNDMCLLAPATLIDRRIQWHDLDAHSVKARFTNAGNTIEATLIFDDEGKLANFISYDRYQSADGKIFKKYPWSTPVREYRDFDGRRIAAVADAVWHEPDGDFCYGKFTLTKVRYNIASYGRTFRGIAGRAGKNDSARPTSDASGQGAAVPR